MITPRSLITRAARTPRLPAGRCPVCHEQIYDAASMLTLRGGIHVHRSCATYRTRQRARAF
jgi:hypothetical protein